MMVILMFGLHQALQAQRFANEPLKQGWRFAPGNHEGAASVNFDDSTWELVDVPHDWAVGEAFIPEGDGNTGKLPWKGEAWYRLQFQIPKASENQRFYLMFDGVMAFPEIFINGHLAGSWDYGYNSFYVDITPFLNHEGRNVLAVHADTRPHRSRWYPGAGIYRKVTLLIRQLVHFEPWGATVTTPIIKAHAAEVRTELRLQTFDQSRQTYTIRHEVYAPNGNLIVEKTTENVGFRTNKQVVETSFLLNHPTRWDVTNPALYRYKAFLLSGSEVLDVAETTFGIREMKLTADDGFHLNGRRLQLRGVNLHHDLGALGAAFNHRALERQLQIMQQMGVNAIRTSHNMPAPELGDLCDSMGLLLFNEAFDKYDSTAGITDTTDFEAFVERNIRNFVRRDGNHPSIFAWSAGNEIPDVQWNQNRGFDRLQTVVNTFKKYDPSRPVTLVCDSYESAKLRHFDFYDFHSWNYGRRYSLARQMEPNKAVIISESASTVSTRGYYDPKLPSARTDFTDQLQVSSYDLNAPEWAEIADDDFMWQQDEPYVAGEFVWTGFDYLGEPTPYTNQWAMASGLGHKAASRSSYFGIVDLCGIPKDRYYLYKSYWKSDESTVHILPHWNWEGHEGDTIPVFVYTSGDCAELFVNGTSQGKKCKQPFSSKSVDRFRLMWNDVRYQPGTLRAVAWKEGEPRGEAVVQTAKAASALCLTADRSEIRANGEDLAYILIEAVDENHVLNPLADEMVTVEISGKATIAGLCNGDPQSLLPMQGHSMQLFNGKAMLIVKSSTAPDRIRIQVKSDKLKKAEMVVESR